ncbi:ribonucleases P/MRP protein subunit POP1-like [Lineus longissimus]|uniref:ribonucleases P/MRP protein subunit POP1-like n=1 Tax=Lineus longissimus TaxID=88925 RepID=UPI002B4DB409
MAEFKDKNVTPVMGSNGEKGIKRKLPNDQRNDSKTDFDLKKKKIDSFVATSTATEIKTVEFAACRAREIEAMTHGIKSGSVNHRVYQRLPKHMRRRAMSHDPKRMPRRLRKVHILELQKSNTKPVSKRPSRRYRRRPKNLQAEYAKRKRRVMWLETHIWHAKRFHMIEKWGYKIALHPNDKGTRAAHRAVSKHCLLHDLSFMCCIEISGAESEIISAFSHLSDKATGLSVGAKAVITGTRQGTIMLYHHDSYPYNVIGPATFIWKPAIPLAAAANTEASEGEASSSVDTHVAGHPVEQTRHLWLWVHPSCYQLVLNELHIVLGLPLEIHVITESVVETGKVKTKSETSNVPGCMDSGVGDAEMTLAKKRTAESEKVEGGSKQKKKIQNDPQEEENVPSNPSFNNDKVMVMSLKDELVRFHLTGPLSQRILADLLSIADVDSAAGGEPDAKWWEHYYSKTANYQHHDLQSGMWDLMKLARTPSDCFSNAVIALTVRDPRVLLPKKKTFFTGKENDRVPLSTEDALKLCRPYPAEVSISAIWESTIRKQTNDKISTHGLNEKRSELLVPGTDLYLGAEESRIPVLLLQNPGTTTTTTKQVDHSLYGYGSGWDLVVPAGWGMAFWLGLIFRGARASGLREFDSTSIEMRALCYPRDYPDGSPGRTWAVEHKQDLETKFCKRPPSKRPNFLKVNAQAPFHLPWGILVQFWKNHRSDIIADSTVAVGECSGKMSECEFYTLRDRQQLDELAKFCCKDGGKKVQPKQKCVEDICGSSVERIQIAEQFQSALVAVTLAMFGRGSPQEMAMICIPLRKDMDKLVKNKQYSGPCEPIVEVKAPPKPAKKKDKTPRNALPVLDPKTVVISSTRKLIGFLTDGKFSLARGSGLGQGFCAVQGLLQLEDFHRVNGQLLVLVRDTNSVQYRFAKLSIHKT